MNFASVERKNSEKILFFLAGIVLVVIVAIFAKGFVLNTVSVSTLRGATVIEPINFSGGQGGAGGPLSGAFCTDIPTLTGSQFRCVRQTIGEINDIDTNQPGATDAQGNPLPISEIRGTIQGVQLLSVKGIQGNFASTTAKNWHPSQANVCGAKGQASKGAPCAKNPGVELYDQTRRSLPPGVDVPVNVLGGGAEVYQREGYKIQVEGNGPDGEVAGILGLPGGGYFERDGGLSGAQGIQDLNKRDDLQGYLGGNRNSVNLGGGKLAQQYTESDSFYAKTNQLLPPKKEPETRVEQPRGCESVDFSKVYEIKSSNNFQACAFGELQMGVQQLLSVGDYLTCLGNPECKKSTFVGLKVESIFGGSDCEGNCYDKYNEDMYKSMLPPTAGGNKDDLTRLVYTRARVGVDTTGGFYPVDTVLVWDALTYVDVNYRRQLSYMPPGATNPEGVEFARDIKGPFNVYFNTPDAHFAEHVGYLNFVGGGI